VVEDLDNHEDAVLDEPVTIDQRSDLARLDAVVTEDPDVLPAAWQAPEAVLCLPGAGKLDEAASIVLAQLLKKRGIGAIAESADALSIARFFSLDLTKAEALCICYVGKPSDAMIQYAVRRLAKKSKGARIIVATVGGERAAMATPMPNITLAAGNFSDVVDTISDVAMGRAPSATLTALAAGVDAALNRAGKV